METKSLLRHTRNTRPLANGSLKFIRSDKPVQVDEDEIRWLLENHITTIVDLRSAWEQAETPTPLKSTEGFTFLSMPTTGGPGMPKNMGGTAGSPGEGKPPFPPGGPGAGAPGMNMPGPPGAGPNRTLQDYLDSYLKMTDANMVWIVKTIEAKAQNSGVLYFCGVGKDRTGVVSALLLLRMGYSDEEIIQDYVLSAEYLHEMLLEDERRNPAMSAAVNAPNVWTMQNYLAEIRPKLQVLFDAEG